MGDRRKHIGVLCSTIEIANQYDIWEGIVEVAEEHDFNLTAYIATSQTSDNAFTSYMETCFDTMFKQDYLDGLIMSSGFIAQNIGMDEFLSYVDKLPKNFPIISISLELPGIPTVITSNKSGMYAAVDHLIRVHGMRNIAFVKGPDEHTEAEERLHGYKDALSDNNIPLNHSYIFQGDFGRISGRRAVASLYDERKLPVEAFVCCNDQSAIGALSVLNKRNIMVPGDVAVVGFDNDIVSTMYVPAMSTVGQDFTKLGRVSAQLLIDKINGKEPDAITYINPEFIGRQSCGCLERKYNQSELFSDADTEESDGTFSAFTERILVKLLQDDVPRKQIMAWVNTLLDTLTKDPFSKDDFLYILDQILVTYYHSYSNEFSVWHKVLIVLAKGMEIYKQEFVHPHMILSALTLATTIVYDIRLRETRKREYTQNDDRMRKRRSTNALLLMFDIDALADELYKAITNLSMNTALIGIYKNPIKRGTLGGNRDIEHLIGFDGEHKFNIQRNTWAPIQFSDYSTIEGFDYDRERRVLFFQPLFFMDEEVGEMLLPFDVKTPTDVYETLRINISTAIKGAKLLTTVHTLSITDELTGLFNRRGFFQFTYSRLQHLQRNEDSISIVMFIDMDGLKLINDNYGHFEGDKALSIFAQLLKESMREGDIIGRMGGDEFAVFSSVKSVKNAEQLEQRLRKAIDTYNAKGLNAYKIGGSIGSVVLEEQTISCFEAAMLSADSVLYEEKMMKRKMGLTRQ